MAMVNTSLPDRIRVGSPCNARWEDMRGDDRIRFCDQCQLNVYNFSELSPGEIESLVANKEGRLCARLYRRVDGTLLTKDCPVGLRAVRLRVSKRVAAVFAAVAGKLPSLRQPSDSSVRKGRLLRKKLESRSRSQRILRHPKL